MGNAAEAEHEFAVAREVIMDLAYTVPDQELRDNFVRRACGMLARAV
jgi:hypothetical protein